MPTRPTSYRLTVSVTGPPLNMCFLAIYLLGMTGCGEKLELAPVDPKVATDAAMEQYDTNSDGFLDLDELAACPALLDARSEYDLDRDKKISREELGDRLSKMYDRGISLISVDCTVKLKNRSLQSALVRFVPEEFLGQDTMIPAVGTTNEVGFTIIAIPAEELTEGLRKYKKTLAGLYRVEITHPSIKIPAKYNTNTELGFEVNPAAHGGSHPVFELDAK